jgi:hypothetical protein
MRKAVPKWSPEDIDAMMTMAAQKAAREINNRWPDLPENAALRKQEFGRIKFEEFRKLSDPNWPA